MWPMGLLFLFFFVFGHCCNFHHAILIAFVVYYEFAVCNCAVHKKCHEKILGQCPGSAKDSRETKVSPPPSLSLSLSLSLS